MSSWAAQLQGFNLACQRPAESQAADPDEPAALLARRNVREPCRSGAAQPRAVAFGGAAVVTQGVHDSRASGVDR